MTTPAFGLFDLLLITPEQASTRIEESTRRALDVLQPERVAVLLRAKHLSAEDRRRLGRALHKLTERTGTALLVSADVALCEELGARGVQLPERGARVDEARARLGENAWIGASKHDVAGLRAAREQGATFATLSPVHATPGKGTPLGLPMFRKLAQESDLPVVALGGVTQEDAPALFAAGAAAIAVIRAVFEHDDPAKAVASFLAAADRARERS